MEAVIPLVWLVSLVPIGILIATIVNPLFPLNFKRRLSGLDETKLISEKGEYVFKTRVASSVCLVALLLFLVLVTASLSGK